MDSTSISSRYTATTAEASKWKTWRVLGTDRLQMNAPVSVKPSHTVAVERGLAKVRPDDRLESLSPMYPDLRRAAVRSEQQVAMGRKNPSRLKERPTHPPGLSINPPQFSIRQCRQRVEQPTAPVVAKGSQKLGGQLRVGRSEILAAEGYSVTPEHTDPAGGVAARAELRRAASNPMRPGSRAFRGIEYCILSDKILDWNVTAGTVAPDGVAPTPFQGARASRPRSARRKPREARVSMPCRSLRHRIAAMPP